MRMCACVCAYELEHVCVFGCLDEMEIGERDSVCVCECV